MESRVRRVLKWIGVLSAFVGSVTVTGTNAREFRVIHSFCAEPDCADGAVATALVRDGAGNLYGATNTGGRKGKHPGLIFELVGGKRYKVLYTFPKDGSLGKSVAGLIVDTAGNLYGTAEFGGANGNANGAGNIFELSGSPDGKKWQLHVLYNFCSQANCIDGREPFFGLSYAGAAQGLLFDGHSPLYGTTGFGGPNDAGVAFELTFAGSSWTQTVLYDFCTDGRPQCADGWQPGSSIFVDASGNLFGTTQFGGTTQNQQNFAGTFYELSPQQGVWTHTVLYNFCSQANCADGADPSGPLVQDAAGNFYGTAGVSDLACNHNGSTCGEIYKLVPNGTSSQEAVLYQFCSLKNCADGFQPTLGVLLDAQGNLFGTATFGGGHYEDPHPSGVGTVFELTNSSLTVLHTFCGKSLCADGWRPGELLADGTGGFFGTTLFGGLGSYDGVVFRVAPSVAGSLFSESGNR